MFIYYDEPEDKLIYFKTEIKNVEFLSLDKYTKRLQNDKNVQYLIIIEYKAGLKQQKMLSDYNYIRIVYNKKN